MALQHLQKLRGATWSAKKASFGAFFKEFYSDAKLVKNKYTSSRRFLFLKHNKRISIREAMLQKKLVRFSYRRIDRVKKVYLGEPYSLRTMRGSDTGKMRLYFYMYHRGVKKKDRGIKCFVLNYIRSVLVTQIGFRPRWKVEIRGLNKVDNSK